ncbi:unnamed protein product [Dracunculus medinensis]|uniref:ANK_REP_REGION domain-containing protein n=1 Tax=Dracunculus medinensis TaxID=318479 RepID=A0A0N4UFI8_DRAME|nr:unnamed protein product [Dracunculus medinensis]
MGDEGSAEDMDQLIFQAAFYDNEELLRDLVQAYPEKVNYKDKYGRSALHLAAQHGNLTIVDLLLAAGANVNSITGPNLSCVTPLHVAAVNGKYAVVQRLINCGAELLAVDLSDHCALELAQMGNHFEVACLLIDAIETERKRVQELHDQLITACINAELDVVKKILANLTNGNSDAVLNGTTLDRKCALYIACLNGRQEVVAELLKVRGHMLIQAITHDTVLHAAISSQEPVIVEMILKAFTHLVTSRNAEGSSVLHWAAQCGNLEVIKILMEFPYDKDLITRIEDVSGRFSYNFVIDVNMLDAQCRTTLYLAVANSHVDVVKYLLEVCFINSLLFYLSLYF